MNKDQASVDRLRDVMPTKVFKLSTWGSRGWQIFGLLLKLVEQPKQPKNQCHPWDAVKGPIISKRIATTLYELLVKDFLSYKVGQLGVTNKTKLNLDFRFVVLFNDQFDSGF